MKGDRSGWGVTTTGLALACGGFYGMWTGWDHIQLERGWSLFISGAVALSGGVVTMALGRVIAHLARLARGSAPALAPSEAASRPEPAPRPAPPVEKTKPADKPQGEPEEKPVEVDRYSVGGATYAMMSDGSVEVRTATSAQRYPSLAALRAEAEASKD